MLPGGRPKGQPKLGGRKKGARNKRTIAMLAAADLCIKYGIEPLELMFKGMKRKIPSTNDFEQKEVVHEYRLKAAAHAAPYVRPRLAQVENRGAGANGENLNLNMNANAGLNLDPKDPATLEIARRIAFALAQGARIQQKQVQPVEKVINPKDKS